MHQPSSGTAYDGSLYSGRDVRGSQVNSGGRTGSLRGYPSRSNSMRSYVYNPSPSYVPGQVGIGNKSARSSSLTLNSPNPRNQASKARRNSLKSRSYLPEVEETETVVTSTTQVVDAMGRTQSITTKTVKTLPDGSNVIETVTKNISRSNSRNNSLRNDSSRNNSFLSNNVNSINLGKIEEDLQDFDYDYEVDNIAPPPKLNLEPGFTLKAPMEGKESPKRQEEIRPVSTISDSQTQVNSDTSPKKPLKSILKNNKRYSVYYDEEKDEYVDAQEELDEINEVSKLNKVAKGKSSAAHGNSPKTYSPEIKRVHSPLSKPISPRFDSPRDFSNDIVSNGSIQSPSSSIKFQEKVETIPIRDENELQEEEMYSAALKVAYEKVYGSHSKKVDPVSDKQSYAPSRRKTLLNMSNKQTNKDTGISSNYVYTHHPKEFLKYSMRDTENSKPTPLKPEDIISSENYKDDNSSKSKKLNIFSRKKKNLETSKSSLNDPATSETPEASLRSNEDNELRHQSADYKSVNDTSIPEPDVDDHDGEKNRESPQDNNESFIHLDNVGSNISSLNADGEHGNDERISDIKQPGNLSSKSNADQVKSSMNNSIVVNLPKEKFESDEASKDIPQTTNENNITGKTEDVRNDDNTDQLSNQQMRMASFRDEGAHEQHLTLLPEITIPQVHHPPKDNVEPSIKKKSSRFKQKIYKYFINSYDK